MLQIDVQVYEQQESSLTYLHVSFGLECLYTYDQGQIKLYAV
jgi:hypothetical protein